MRSCEEFELLINLYLDDMLPSEETRPLKEHLKECQACRERYRQLSALKAALGDLDEPAPEGLHGRILDYVEKNCPESAPTVSAAPLVPCSGRRGRLCGDRRCCRPVCAGVFLWYVGERPGQYDEAGKPGRQQRFVLGRGGLYRKPAHCGYSFR